MNSRRADNGQPATHQASDHADSVNVRRGRERLLDTGVVVIDGQTLKITFSLGPHPLRQLLSDAGSLNPALALPGFCRILRP